jgi:uncharacterized protein DUF1207
LDGTTDSILRNPGVAGIAGAIGFVLALLLPPKAAAEAFPVGDVFRPLVADPTEPRTFLSILSLKTPSDTFTVASIGAGVNFGLYRWPGERAGDGWQVGLFGSVFSQFNLDSSSDDLINSDYRIGLPLSYKRGVFSARASLFHQSSHLGDELILSGSAPQRLNLSFEAVDFVAALELGRWRPYAGGFYLVGGDLEGLKETGLHAGLDYAGRTPMLWGARLVAGLDLKWFEETDWRAGVSGKIGLEFGRPRPERRGITVLLEAYDGFAPFGQFYRDDVTYYGAAVQFDF